MRLLTRLLRFVVIVFFIGGIALFLLMIELAKIIKLKKITGWL